VKEAFIEYLKAIGMTKTFQERIEKIYEFYSGICTDEISSIFVTDYIKEDGTREYENLWFFSETYCMEAKQFITKDDFDITPIQNHVYYWAIQKQDYDFKNAVEKSRLSLSFDLDTRIVGSLKASKENCDFLRDIIHKYVIRNLKK